MKIATLATRLGMGLSFLMLGACGGNPETRESPELVDSNDSALIGGTEFTAAQAAQTGILAIKDGCTATLIGRRQILTAAHCAQSPTYVWGGPIKIAQTGRLTAATVWTTVTVSKPTSIQVGQRCA